MQFDHPLLWASVKMFAGRLGLAAVVFGAFWFAGSLLGRLIRHVAGRTTPEREELLRLAARVAQVAIRICGGVTALGTLGVDVSALVAGLGLTGFALGFALKDALSNVLAGAMILFYRPFRRGSHITVSGYTGIVTEIDLRYTCIRAPEGDVLLPNSSLLTNPITVRAARSEPEPPVTIVPQG